MSGLNILLKIFAITQQIFFNDLRTEINEF